MHITIDNGLGHKQFDYKVTKWISSGIKKDINRILHQALKRIDECPQYLD